MHQSKINQNPFINIITGNCNRIDKNLNIKKKNGETRIFVDFEISPTAHTFRSLLATLNASSVTHPAACNIK